MQYYVIMLIKCWNLFCKIHFNHIIWSNATCSYIILCFK